MRQQNFKKNPHTARWLRTFHDANGANYHNEAPAETDEERAALEFVGAAGQAANREIFIRGWRVLTGPGLITEPQAKWIVDIAETRDGVSDAMVASLAERLTQGFAKSAATAFITKYKSLPKRVTAGPSEDPTVPVRDAQGVRPGRYAIVTDGVTKFYRITEGKGRWAGRTFIEAQASDDHYPVRNTEARAAVLKAIAESPLEAEQRYGRELGACSRCGRTLTDETSRARGIGPDCWSKV